MITLISCILIMQTPVELFNQANALYQEGAYAGAIAVYETAVESVRHPDLFYNLGNAYFKQGDIGRAIANYQRALFLAPRDQDINYNLLFARNYRVDKIRVQESPFTVLLRRVFRILSMTETQICTTLLFVITSLFLSLFTITRRSLYGYICLGAFILCLLFGFNWLAWTNHIRARSAVVTAPEVSALSGPGEDYKEILVLHDGAEVRVREIRGDYALIQVPGGLGGWIPAATIEEIF
jgi:tetratricopeptide (TPR) repeat protein